MRKKHVISVVSCLILAIVSHAQTTDIKIISYNIAMLGLDKIPGGVANVLGTAGIDKAKMQPHREERNKLVPNVVRDYEIVVISEAFDDQRRNDLNKMLGDLGFKHSCILGSKDNGSCPNGDHKSEICIDGGVIIYSKYEILEQDQLRYYETDCEVNILGASRPECWGHDCQAKKGALYVRVRKNGINFNVFGTHTQASYDGDAKYKEARKIQFEKLNNFIISKKIPKNEPIIIAGDLNVNMLSDKKEYENMLIILNAYHPDRIGVNYTQGPQPNSCLDHDHEEYLDYILFRKDHALPYEATIETKIVSADYKIKTGLLGLGKGKKCSDISDHFPVVCNAKFIPPALNELWSHVEKANNRDVFHLNLSQMPQISNDNGVTTRVAEKYLAISKSNARFDLPLAQFPVSADGDFALLYEFKILENKQTALGVNLKDRNSLRELHLSMLNLTRNPVYASAHRYEPSNPGNPNILIASTELSPNIQSRVIVNQTIRLALFRFKSRFRLQISGPEDVLTFDLDTFKEFTDLNLNLAGEGSRIELEKVQLTVFR